MKHLFLFSLFASSCFGFQTDLVFPWVTNNSFQSEIVINNPNDHLVTVNLLARRPANQTPNEEMVQGLEIRPLSQLSMSAAELFPNLGVGAGYLIRLTSDDSNIEGAFVVRNGTSPAQANVFRANDSASRMIFNLLPADDGGFAAPVIINMGNQEAQVTYYAFQDGQEVLPPNLTRPSRTVPAQHPHAELITDLFPGAKGNLMVIAESDQPLLGTAFLFNERGEPSMANARPINDLPGAVVSFSPAQAVNSAGETWILFELVVNNRDVNQRTMTKLEILVEDQVITSFNQQEIAARAFRSDTTIAPFSLRTVYLAPKFAPSDVPRQLVSRVTFDDGHTISTEIPVSSAPVQVIGPPMEGANWLATNALSNDTNHRRATFRVNGKFACSQRFAVDWIQVTVEGLSYQGDPALNENYLCYGDELLAVEDGTVIRVRDGVPDNDGPGFPPGITLDNLAGNFLVLDLGNGHFVTYAHIIPGSFQVQEGDQVKRGDVLALLGNSGNSSEPHLHFHITSEDPGPTGVLADGLPFVLDWFFNPDGTITNRELVVSGQMIAFPTE